MTIADDQSSRALLRELDDRGSRDLFERACRDELGATAAEFQAARSSGLFPKNWDIAAVSRVEFLLPFAK